MIGMAGTAIATASFTTPKRGVTLIGITPDRKIWTLTDAGGMWRTMATYGSRRNQRAGCPIVMAIGFTSLITAGRGLATSRGAGRRITTDAGWCTKTRGRGGRDR